ncbi:MAG: alpha/beta hydrolase [Chloroflexi bacterium]|nr:MAG: alpha/beta hydrolase [Chloroflexota bacterium]
MKTRNVRSQRVMPEHYTTGFVTSRDGTNIGYRQLGHGPGIVLLHGMMSSAHNHMQLAASLADAFTIYLPDRRGRGLSGPYSAEYNIEQEVEDLNALLDHTGVHNLAGISAGGIISLQAALNLPAIHKLAIYEPPLFIDKAVPALALRRFDRELSQSRVAAALFTAMKESRIGPPMFSAMPRWLAIPLTKLAMAQDDKNNAGYIPMRELAPTLHYDFQLSIEMSGRLEYFKAVPARVLLLGGGKSPAYFKVALDSLEKVLPHVKRVEFPELDHAASWNTDRGGQPEPVARELRKFFAEP